MSTKIFSANIQIGSDANSILLERVACKRLPLHIHLANEDFIEWLKIKCAGDSKSDKRWNATKKDKITGLPVIKIQYLKYLGDVASERELTF